MILQAKDLSPGQKLALESLLNRSLSDEDQISIQAVSPPPDWLRSIQEDAARKGLDKLTTDDIDAEIAAARRERKRQPVRDPGCAGHQYRRLSFA